MATMLVDTLAGDFDASEFEDDYAAAVEMMVKAKIEGGEMKRTPTSTKSSGEVVDLLAALQRSVDAAKSGRRESDESDEDSDDSDNSEQGSEDDSDEEEDEDKDSDEKPPLRRWTVGGVGGRTSGRALWF